MLDTKLQNKVLFPSSGLRSGRIYIFRVRRGKMLWNCRKRSFPVTSYGSQNTHLICARSLQELFFLRGQERYSSFSFGRCSFVKVAIRIRTKPFPSYYTDAGGTLSCSFCCLDILVGIRNRKNGKAATDAENLPTWPC